jgi:site-specific DNA-methyltransferase (adenine-specific)
MKETGSIYVFGDKNMIAEHWFSELHLPYKELLIWYYKNSPKPRGRWRQSMQGLIYGYKSNDSPFYENEARIEYLPATKRLNGRTRPSPGRLRVCKPYVTSVGALPRDVIEHPALLGHLSKERVGHPDQKPIGLIEKLILTSSNRGDIVFDPFLGSGTTLKACIETERTGLGFEINFEYEGTIEERTKIFEVKSENNTKVKQ